MNKINKTSYCFLLVLKYIIEHNVFNIDDVLNYLELECDIFVYKETILKYIRTLRHSGFKLKKINNKIYKLTYSPFAKHIPNDEKIVITNLKPNEFLIDENVDKTFEKLKIIIPEITDHLNFLKIQDNEIKKFKKYCKEKLRLKITYTKDNALISSLVEPYELVFLDNVWKLKVYDVSNKANIFVDINNVLKVTQTPTKNKYEFKDKSVTLKFLQELSRSYTLKPNEEIIEKEDNAIYVSSTYYDKEFLFNNVLKYLGKCEIIDSQPLREDFIEYVENLYKMYDCIK